MGPKKIVKRVVVVRRKVVAAKPVEPVVKKLGVLDDLNPFEAEAADASPAPKKRRREASSDPSADGSDASSDEEVERAAQRRRKMVNEDMLGRFQSKQSNNFVEADVPEAREVPLISDDMRAALKKRRTEHRAPALVETQDAEAPPAAASFVELTSPSPSEAAVSSPFGAGDMISFDAADDDGAARVGDHAVPMWCTRRYTHHNRMVRLHDEAVDLVRYLRPTHEEEVMRKKVVVDVTHIAAMLFPGCRVVTFGSLVTGLVLPTSDVDLTITLEMEGKEELHAAMDKLATYIQGQGLCDEAYPQVIKQTKVPLVKFTHKETWIDVDISFNAPNGRVNSEMVVQYCNRLPVVFPLVTLIKYFLQQRSMHEPFTGGLGSYAVSLLVVAFLQHHPAFQMGADASKAGLGGLLMDFFWFYGSVFSFRDAVIAVGDTNLRRKTRPEAGDRASCFLLDPQNVQNNVASSTRQLEPIRSAFHHAFLALSSDQFPAVPEGEKSAEHPHIQNRVCNAHYTHTHTHTHTHTADAPLTCDPHRSRNG